jgi:hydroxypyruvate reductase
MSEPIHVLAVSKLSPLWAPQLAATYTVHDRLHETDPAAFAAIAPRIRAIAASGESKVPASLIAQLPALEVISVMGVGYDGVDVAAAKARGIPVTHTPNVLNDDVADLALGLMLSAARQLPQADRYVREGLWPQKGHAAGAQDVGRAAGHRGHGAHRAGHRHAGRGLRHVHRLHRAQRQGRRALPLPAHAKAWPPRATSWSSSRPVARHAQADQCRGAGCAGQWPWRRASW